MTEDAKIIRQACLKAAGSALSGSGVTADDVCVFAARLEEWVHQGSGEDQNRRMAEAIVSQELKATKSGGGHEYKACPKCGSGVFDNREKKRTGEYKSTAPNWKCRDKDTCGWVTWD